MRDRRLSVSVLDLRNENQFNRFHLIDALQLKNDFTNVKAIPPRTVKVLVANDEPTETAAFRLLARQRIENLYVLSGGLPAWVALFDAQALHSERLAALGEAHPYSRPPPNNTSTPAHYVAKVKRPGLGGKKSGGGCGG
jgi:rhodanese-related sulfurtransferase